MASITVTLDGNLLREVALNKERITIGRRPHNDIVLDMRAVSAEHAAIITILHDSFLEDLNSTNGTQVNGLPVRKHFLQDQDVIQLAKYEIRYRSDQPQVSSTALPADDAVFPNTLSVNHHGDAAFARAGSGVTGEAGLDAQVAAVPIIRVLTGPNAGQEIPIVKSLTTIGRPGVQVAVITRRPHGFLLTHVEGDEYPLVDGVSIGTSAHPIVSGDVVNLSGTELEFV
ncbi:MAG: FHA domain-containing protein, partial [Pseudomonadota bacterium]|nr:FHA domain-containing protein [Pseudomonadota bacterium]